MKHTAKQKTRPKVKAAHEERHKRRTRRGRRMRKVAQRLLAGEPTSVDLEKARPSDTGRYGA